MITCILLSLADPDRPPCTRRYCGNATHPGRELTDAEYALDVRTTPHWIAEGGLHLQWALARVQDYWAVAGRAWPPAAMLVENATLGGPGMLAAPTAMEGMLPDGSDGLARAPPYKLGGHTMLVGPFNVSQGDEGGAGAEGTGGLQS